MHVAVGDPDDLACSGITELGNHAAIAHLLAVRADVLKACVIFLEVLGLDGDRHRELRLDDGGF
ncbi:hypothetical protein CU110_06470 [Cobetia sp. ICG0124]|nr:hypothetical protein CU110_06470 [Cobetia sp. ICG0124]